VKSRIWRDRRRHAWHTIRWFFGDTVPRFAFGFFDRIVSLLIYSQRDDETVGPVVLLLPSKHVRLVRWRILDWFTRNRSTSSRMHGGPVVTRTEQIVEVSQSSPTLRGKVGESSLPEGASDKAWSTGD
jgi:hypothetical protein